MKENELEEKTRNGERREENKKRMDGEAHTNLL